jgi:hypothetical protein
MKPEYSKSSVSEITNKPINWKDHALGTELRQVCLQGSATELEKAMEQYWVLI